MTRTLDDDQLIRKELEISEKDTRIELLMHKVLEGIDELRGVFKELQKSYYKAHTKEKAK